MTAVEVISCVIIAFGPALNLFMFFISKDPLRIILFVLGAFFWLLSLLLSAVVWFAVVPLREKLYFGLFFSVGFQEVGRLAYYYLLKRAQIGLDRLGESGMKIHGIHSLKHARHMLAVVAGLGMGVMSAAFLLVNVLADMSGKGVPGFPASLSDVSKADLPTYVGLGDFHFCLMSTLSAMILSLEHVAWTVVFWDGCHKFSERAMYKWWWTSILGVTLSHYVSTYISLLNEQKLYYATLPVQALVLLVNTVAAYYSMGGSFGRIIALLRGQGRLATMVPVDGEHHGEEPIAQEPGASSAVRRNLNANASTEPVPT